MNHTKRMGRAAQSCRGLNCDPPRKDLGSGSYPDKTPKVRSQIPKDFTMLLEGEIMERPE